VTRAVYVIGPPGVGKTTLMERLKADYLEVDARRAWPGSLLWLTPLYRIPHNGVPDGVELGRRRATFGGTDALGMAVMPHACDWIANTRVLPGVVFGEGARLGTVRFLSGLSMRADLLVVHLIASPEALTARRQLRGSDQSDAWMRGAATRAANAAEALRTTDTAVLTLDATEATPSALAAQIMETTQ
jgi:hypothetical protein